MNQNRIEKPTKITQKSQNLKDLHNLGHPLFFQSKLNELEGRYYAKEHQVTELIEAKIREFNERAQEQMQEYATDLVEAHKMGFAQRALDF